MSPQDGVLGGTCHKPYHHQVPPVVRDVNHLRPPQPEKVSHHGTYPLVIEPSWSQSTSPRCSWMVEATSTLCMLRYSSPSELHAPSCDPARRYSMASYSGTKSTPSSRSLYPSLSVTPRTFARSGFSSKWCTSLGPTTLSSEGHVTLSSWPSQTRPT